MNENNFIVILPFMINELGLKSNELLVYAIVHGISQDGESWYEAGITYLAKTLNLSRQSIRNILNSLVEKNLIVEKQVQQKHVKKVYLQTNQRVKKFDLDSKKNLPPIIIRKENKTIYSQTLSRLVNEYTANNQLKAALWDYLEFRKKDKKYSGRALELGLRKLDKLSFDDGEKIGIVNQSIENCWKSFYPLRESEVSGFKQYPVESKQPKVSYDEIEDLL